MYVSQTARNALAEQLAAMDPAEITRLRAEAISRHEEEERRKAQLRLNDPHGTVRYDTENDMFLVRDTEDEDVTPYWTAYPNERHGNYLEDDMINASQCPVIGMLPDLPTWPQP